MSNDWNDDDRRGIQKLKRIGVFALIFFSGSIIAGERENMSPLVEIVLSALWVAGAGALLFRDLKKLLRPKNESPRSGS